LQRVGSTAHAYANICFGTMSIIIALSNAVTLGNPSSY